MSNFILIVLGILSAAMGVKGFLLSSHFIDGGVVGICMLLAELTRLPLGALLVLINAPFLVLGYYAMGKRFTVKSGLAILGLAATVAWMPFPDVTPDKLLTAVFGGLFIGAGIGLTIRGGAVLDGTEIAALLINRFTDLLRVGDIILLLNLVIFGVALFILGVEPALYSILTYLAASKMVNFLVYGLEEYTALSIVSDHHETIASNLVNQLNRSITVLNGYSAGNHQPRPMIYCVVTKLEIGTIRQAVFDVDPNAFIITQALADVHGGVIKKGLVH